MLQFLEESGELHLSAGRYFWTADKYPANGLSLRSAGGAKVLLQALDGDRLTTIGEVDQASALWMVHPQAIYLQEGQTFRVDELDLENHRAQLSETSEDYYTEPHTKVDFTKLSVIRQQETEFCQIFYGEIQVTATVTGYRKVRWFTHEILGNYPLELPPTDLQTTAFWLCLPDSTVDKLRDLGLWKNDPNNYGPNWMAQKSLARRRDRYICQICGVPENGQAHHVHHKVPFRQFPTYVQANQLDNLITLCPSCHQRAEGVIRMRSGLAGLGYVLHQLSPLFLMCDIGDLGSAADPQSILGDGMPTIVIYDLIPAGIGLSEQIYNIESELLQRSFELVKDCECLDGCPSCVGPAGENGVGGKQETLALLSILINSNYPASPASL
jgi:DEAD/DEAH box helicase domain-containing protein